MKTTSTLLMAIFISLASFAAPVQSKLSITVVGNKDVEIVVDNNRYQSNDNSVVINSLQPGSHNVKVFSLKRNQRRNVWGNNSQLIYSSNVYVRPGYFVGITIDRNGRATFNETAIRNDRRNNDRDDRYNDRNDRYDRRNDDDNYSRRPVTEQSFSSIVQTLRREYSENSRLVLARQIIDRNYFTSEQVKYMMQLFSFENNRVEIAKLAYRYTTDQRNYFVVYDALSYSNSKEQLADYIRRAN
ncbi:MAG TPA: DUF4476 domain-containing protein [Flavitalea sp.]|nr:DUF4476 domain-containing protein [Flavitalea sp.]